MSTTLQSIGAELEKLGFSKYAIGKGFHGSEPQFTSTFREDWQNHYFENGFFNLDPLPFCALAGTAPIRWTEIKRRMKKSPVMNAAEDYGMHEGFAFSLNGYVVSSVHDGSLSNGDLQFVQESIRRLAISSSDMIEPLTSSQQGLVDLLGVGLQYNQIADILGISVDGVKSAKKRLFQKYGANSDAQLMRILRNE